MCTEMDRLHNYKYQNAQKIQKNAVITPPTPTKPKQIAPFVSAWSGSNTTVFLI
jgi:hypothetical protein